MPNTELLGIVAIVIMVIAYAMEKRHSDWIALFAIGCVMAAVYAFLIRSYPFLIAEGVWAVVALMRWRNERQSSA